MILLSTLTDIKQLEKTKPRSSNSSSYRTAYWILLIMSLVSCNSHKYQTPDRADYYQEKQKGIHLFGRIDSTSIQPFVKNNYEWISLVPYGGQKDYDSPNLRYVRGDSTQMLRRDSAWISKIDIAHKSGFKVMLKPHVWLGQPSEGKWRSDIFHKDREQWDSWKEDYREFILHYAAIGEKAKVDLFCIGAEFTRLTLEKPAYWRSLITEIKSIYSGKLCYAANWYQEYENITFWDELDYIGIQAYFPLSNQEEPSLEQLHEAWDKFLAKLEKISTKYNKPILFTELGYKSTSDAATKPWEWMDYQADHEKKLSMLTQANCYQAFFDKVWDQWWFAGVHIWQARTDWKAGTSHSDLDFTPQGKLAEGIIKEAFR